MRREFHTLLPRAAQQRLIDAAAVGEGPVGESMGRTIAISVAINAVRRAHPGCFRRDPRSRELAMRADKAFVPPTVKGTTA